MTERLRGVQLKEAAFPKAFRPLKPVEVREGPKQKGKWISSFLFAGYRAIVFSKDGNVTIKVVTAEGLRDVTQALPEVQESVRQIGTNVIVDGQLIYGNGILPYEKEAVSERFKKPIEPFSNKEFNLLEIGLVVDDLPYMGAYDLRREPYMERFEFLRQLIPSHLRKRFSISPNVIEVDRPSQLKYTAENLGYPGVNYRLKSGYYLPNPDSPPWLILKFPPNNLFN